MNWLPVRPIAERVLLVYGVRAVSGKILRTIFGRWPQLAPKIDVSKATGADAVQFLLRNRRISRITSFLLVACLVLYFICRAIVNQPESFYKILQLRMSDVVTSFSDSRSSGNHLVKSQYRRLSRSLHPDKFMNASQELRDAVESKFIAITRAANCLGDELCFWAYNRMGFSAVERMDAELAPKTKREFIMQYIPAIFARHFVTLVIGILISAVMRINASFFARTVVSLMFCTIEVYLVTHEKDQIFNRAPFEILQIVRSLTDLPMLVFGCSPLFMPTELDVALESLAQNPLLSVQSVDPRAIISFLQLSTNPTSDAVRLTDSIAITLALAKDFESLLSLTTSQLADLDARINRLLSLSADPTQKSTLRSKKAAQDSLDFLSLLSNPQSAARMQNIVSELKHKAQAKPVPFVLEEIEEAGEEDEAASATVESLPKSSLDNSFQKALSAQPDNLTSVTSSRAPLVDVHAGAQQGMQSVPSPGLRTIRTSRPGSIISIESKPKKGLRLRKLFSS